TLAHVPRPPGRLAANSHGTRSRRRDAVGGAPIGACYAGGCDHAAAYQADLRIPERTGTDLRRVSRSAAHRRDLRDHRGTAPWVLVELRGLVQPRPGNARGRGAARRPTA